MKISKMMKNYFFVLLLVPIMAQLPAQSTADFENFNLSVGQFINDAGEEGGFSSGPIFLPNTYDEGFDFWSGWAISATSDTETPGYLNQYSAITGQGYDGSATYAITFAFDPQIIALTGDAAGGRADGMYVTNSTYAFLSMRDGDGVAKRFGGETGNDPDFFRLTIKKYLNGELSQDSIDFYLADYRFADNSQDYLVDEWTYIDLTPLGPADSLQCSLTSTDIGDFGMNTPAYFCLDHFVADEMVNTQDLRPRLSLRAFPNPTTDWVQVTLPAPGQVRLLNNSGQVVRELAAAAGQLRVSLANLPKGMYRLQWSDGPRQAGATVVKQ